jgi:CDP-4-dehydro-6-deoxyglucose reductase
LKFIPVLSEPLTSDAWQGRTGFVHQAVLDDFADLSAHEVYCCGAPVMVDTASATFKAQGLPADAFFSDAFTYANPAPKV